MTTRIGFPPAARRSISSTKFPRAVLSPAGQRVNGAKAWIALPGGFQIEPSEFAKLGLVLGTAWILSRRRIEPTESKNAGRPGLKDVALAVLAAAPLILLVEREPALGVMLVLVFTLAVTITLVHNRDVACHCFGSLAEERVSGRSLVQLGLLLQQTDRVAF